MGEVILPLNPLKGTCSLRDLCDSLCALRVKKSELADGNYETFSNKYLLMTSRLRVSAVKVLLNN